MIKVKKDVKVGTSNPKVRKSIQDDYAKLPEPWTVSDDGKYFVREVFIQEYEETDIPNETIRGDANAGYDLRQRREINWAGELFEQALTNKGKQLIKDRAVKYALEHGEPASVTLQLLQSVDAALQYASEHGIE